jgi:Ner family transcriptional regulator
MAQKARDWHPEDIKAAVRRTGITLMELAAQDGLAKQACSTTLMRPWPRVQAIIAARIGVEPKVIWPSRYDAHGNPLSYREITVPDVVVPSQKRKAA